MYEQEREQLLLKAKNEFEEAEEKHEKTVGQLKEEIAAVHKDRDESLLMAENDKQQALHLAEAERLRITDRLNKSNAANDQLKTDQDALKNQLYDTMEKAQQTELKKDEQIKDLQNLLEDTK